MNTGIGDNRKSKVSLVGRLSKMLIMLSASIALFAIMTGCSALVSENTDRIDRPFNNVIPIDGTWKLKRCLNVENNVKNNKDIKDPILGEKIGFTRDTMSFAGNYYTNVSYKIKRVDANEYFLHKNPEMRQCFNLESNEILVITAYSDDKFLYEFVKDSADMLTVNIDDQYYCLDKISDTVADVANSHNDMTKQADIVNAETAEQVLQSGLLLGLKIPVTTEDGLGDYTYSTYWISAINRGLRPVYYTKDIYLPRMDGFWRLRVEKKMGIEGIEDFIHASKVSKGVETPMLRPVENITEKTENISRRVETGVRKAIVYVGNDYVCIEKTVYDRLNDSDEASFKKTLRTLPVDNLTNIDGIEISDLAGENGSLAMESAVTELMKESRFNDIQSTDYADQKKNFALFRKTGHWFFKGRLNLSSREQLPYMDFNLNLIPPSNMVAFDILQVPWTEMKDKLPQALDIYTSPNKDLAVILTRDEILLYTIENKTLSDLPLFKFPLAEGSSVIMAEWAMGEYVSSWEKSFINNNTAIQVESN